VQCVVSEPVLVDRIQVHKVKRISQSKSNIVYTGYTWSPLTQSPIHIECEYLWMGSKWRK
jgi:hypothetical protein